MPITLFEAKYAGECVHCLAEFYPGELIGFNEDDELVCQQCAKEISKEEEMTMPQTGGWKRARKKGQI